MYKTITTLIITVLLSLLGASCSSDHGYRQGDADRLVAKIQQQKPLTQDDYRRAIELLDAASRITLSQLEAVKDRTPEALAQKAMELQANEENATRDQAMAVLASYLTSHQSLMDADNQKAWAEAQRSAADRLNKFLDTVKTGGISLTPASN